MLIAHKMVERAKNITFYTGAGISTASGIPDYRGPQGVWTRNPMAKRRSTTSHYISDPLASLKIIQLDADDYEPNAGHLALARVQAQERLCGVVTTNVDGLHRKSGIAPERLVEVHGRNDQAKCLQCHNVTDEAITYERVKLYGNPKCLKCGGLLKPNVVFFENYVDPVDLERACVMSEECDLFVVVGSTLSVPPTNGLLLNATNKGIGTIIINNAPTQLDRDATVVWRGDANKILPELFHG